MTSKIAIIVGLVGVIGFFAFCQFRYKRTLTLADGVTAIIAFSAIWSGAELFYRLLVKDDNLGSFEDSRFIIIIGAFASVWVAFVTIADIARRHSRLTTIRENNENHPVLS